eukprot:1094737-Amorphochlora_amoeboformis.AAC.1
MATHTLISAGFGLLVLSILYAGTLSHGSVPLRLAPVKFRTVSPACVRSPVVPQRIRLAPSFTRRSNLGITVFSDIEAGPATDVPDVTAGTPPAEGVKYKVGDRVLSFFSEDELWYNAEIKEVIEEGKTYLMYYSDYGNEEERDISQIKVDDGTGETWQFIEPQ